MSVTVMICVDGEDQARWSEIGTWLGKAGTADLAEVVKQVGALLSQLQAACSADQKAALAKAAAPEKAAAIDSAAAEKVIK